MADDIYARPIANHGGSKYLRLIYPADGKGAPILVDVYSVIEAFAVTCPGRQQAIKKILCAGLRGKGSQMDDLKGVFDAMWRAMDLQKQREHSPISSEVRESRLNGYDGVPCPLCNELKMVKSGKKWACEACGKGGVFA